MRSRHLIQALPCLYEPPEEGDEDTLPGEGSGVRAFFDTVVRELETLYEDEVVVFRGIGGRR